MTAEKVTQSAAPSQIGPFRILDTLGEGGMGTVYFAEQSTPVKRRVALKLIKLGMDSKAVVARFEQERQALALMQHDGIAKVFDCGTSERGQPFFVMELVKGVPLADFCDERRLSLPDRLKLIQQVCDAVTHAHQKGVIHRDLKPGNVLVSEDQGKVQIKIIDFGLAKAMGQKLVEATLFTEKGQVVGTPEYMAPEQADPGNADIDTRADIYSLGVMLYEVLTGQLPFSAEELRKAGLLEMQRVLKEVEPLKPSTKLSSDRDSVTTIAAQRRISAAALRKALRNDLDWVVLKALEKDRARRYDTANALSADLRRYLEHEPLVAGPPSAGYRLRKLVRRYRGQVVAATLVLLALLGGGIGTFVQFLRAEAKSQENATLAQEKGDLAASLDGKVREFDQLAGVVLYERAIATESGLWPPWPHKIGAMEAWLRDTGALLAKRPAIERTVRDLEARALPQTPEEAERDRRSHHRYQEYNVAQLQLASLRRAKAMRDGKVELVVPELPPAVRAMNVGALNSFAWARIAPPTDSGVAQRRVFGEEAVALAAARVAVDKASWLERRNCLRILAWAELANGQDDHALGHMSEAFENSSKPVDGTLVDESAEYARSRESLAASIDQQAAVLSAVEETVRQLANVISVRRTYTFGTEEASEPARFLHGVLRKLLGDLSSLERSEKADVELRLSWARQAGICQAHPRASVMWSAAREAIALADGVRASTSYAGKSIPLPEDAVIGLVPIGMNPATRLWEFYDLRSAWDGTQPVAEIEIPRHDAKGNLLPTGTPGIVFVLLPGATFLMGAQNESPGSPNYCEHATGISLRLSTVTIGPFLLARHEMTQLQWARLSSPVHDDVDPSYFKRASYSWSGPMRPVESVSHEQCLSLLRRHSMTLPTEAQWEYTARAGRTREPTKEELTSEADCSYSRNSRQDAHDREQQALGRLGQLELAMLRRVFDNSEVTSMEVRGRWISRQDLPLLQVADPLEVNWPLVVGSLGSNPWGFYDMLGNVEEWCLDPHGDRYPERRPDDGLGLSGSDRGRMAMRGGNWQTSNDELIGQVRWGESVMRSYQIGLRPARRVQ